MRFVLDANLVGDWFLPGQQSAATGAVFDAYRLGPIACRQRCTPRDGESLSMAGSALWRGHAPKIPKRFSGREGER